MSLRPLGVQGKIADFSFRSSYSMQHWEQLRFFLADHYGADFPLCSRSYFEWHFKSDAQGIANLFSAWDGRRLIGILGYCPSPTFWGTTNEVVSAAWIGPWMVDRSYRSGVGLALLMAARKRFPLVLGIKATSENARIVQRLGWQYLPRVPRLLVILDAARSRSFALHNALPPCLEPSAMALASDSQIDVRVLADSTYRPEWGAYPAMSFGTVRSFEYLQRTYLHHPGLSYVTAIVGDPLRPSVCVYRIERAMDDPRLVVGRLFEFFHPDDDAGERDAIRLIHLVCEEMRAAGCAYADFVGTSARYGRTLENSGWTRDDSVRPALPVRIQPIERKPFYYDLEYVASTEVPTPMFGDMYVTRTDGNGDSPPSPGS